MKILTISGVDGSGKSTQIKLLQEYLEVQGARVFYFHAIEFGLATKLAEFKKKYCLICKIKGMCKVKSEAKSVTQANWLQIQARKIFLRIDIWRFKKLCKNLEKENYNYILSDRYFYDSIINIEYLSDSTWTLGVQVEKPDLAIYLKADPEIIMSRERKPDQGLAYLQAKKAIFDRKSKEWDLAIIDGNRAKEIIFEEIKKYVKE